MSIRPIKQVTAAVPTLEGAGVKLRRALASGTPTKSIRFCSLTISATRLPTTTGPGFPGTRIVGSRPSPTSWLAASSTATVLATGGILGPATSSG